MKSRRKSITAEERRVYEAVRQRAIDALGYEGCEECGHNGTRYNLQRSHTIPRSQGGKTTVDNVRLLCARCHSHGEHNGGMPYIDWGK